MTKACDLIVMDPTISAEDMLRCRKHIESLPDLKDRWSEFQKFSNGSYFRTWNLARLRLAPVSEDRHEVVAIRHEQEWFLPTFFETWMALPDALNTSDDLEKFLGALEGSSRYSGWSEAALEALRSRVFPRFSERLEASGVGRNDTSATSFRSRLARLKTPDPNASDSVPPVPPSAPPAAPGVIGVARLEPGDNGELHLWMRSTPTTGSIGDIYVLCGSYDTSYSDWLRHLGHPPPGELRPIPAFKE